MFTVTYPRCRRSAAVLLLGLPAGAAGFLAIWLVFRGVASPPKGPSGKIGANNANPVTVRRDDKFLVLSELDKKWESYHKLIKPQPGEWKFADIPWARTIWEARQKAAEVGKPLFIWYMAGEPLGQC